MTLAGQRLCNGRFVVRGELGAGAQAQTLLAWDESSDSEVCLKRFVVRGASSWKDVELAEREASVLAALSHPALPRYVHHFEEDGALYLVMERVEGQSLLARKSAGRGFSQGEAWRFLEQVSRVLDYLHGRTPPLVHRDIKPANVIERPDGTFVLVDFGSVQQRLTSSGGSTVAGTFAYMAPEQLHGRASAAADVHAVGATVLAMLTGREPEELPHRGLGIDVRRALSSNADARLVRVLGRMLEPDPERRAPRIAPLLAAQPIPHRAARIVAAALALIVLLAGAGVVLGQRDRARARPSRNLPAYWARADFAGASRALGDATPADVSALASHLLASDFPRAATCARKLASTRAGAEVTLLLCLADALDARAGDRGALARLEVAAGSSESPRSCRLLTADLASGAERARWATRSARSSFWLDDWDSADDYAEALLAFEVDAASEPATPDYYPIGALIDPHALLVRRPLGLELSLPFSSPERLLLGALVESHLGDHAAAADALWRGLHAAGVGGYWQERPERGALCTYRIAGSDEQRRGWRRLFFLAAVLAARAGEVDNARRYLDLAPEETHGRSLLVPYLDALSGVGLLGEGTERHDHHPETRALWQLARDDRGALSRKLRSARVTGLGVLPFLPPARVQTRELRRWAEAELPAPCAGCLPQALFRDLAHARRIASAVGSRALERELAERIERVRTAWLRRDIAIPLYVLAHLDPP